MTGKWFVPAGCVLMVAQSLVAGENPSSNVNLTKTDGVVESGWVLQVPSGPSDFFNVRFVLDSSLPPALRHGTLQGVYPIHDEAPRVGFYRAKPGLDSTPDLSQPVSEAFAPPVSNGYVDLPDVDLASLPDGTYHLVMQFPPGDSGLIGVGADSDGSDGGGGKSNPFDSSYYSIDGYQTPAQVFPFGDFLLDLVVRPAPADGAFLSTTNDASVTFGDYRVIAVNRQKNTGIAFFGPNPSGDQWLLFLSTPSGLPQATVSPLLGTTPDADGGWARLGAKFPPGFSGMTFYFVAGWANFALAEQGFSNVIEIQVP